MRGLLAILTMIAVMVTLMTMAGGAAAEQTLTAAEVMQGNTSVPFTRNMGQWPDSILYRADASGATMWFTHNGVYYQFTRRIATDDDGIDPDDPFGPRRVPGGRDMARDSVEMLLIKAQFEGANAGVEVIGLDEMEYKCNYFLGNDPAKWRSDVPNYRSIVMREIYPGVDVHFEGSDRGRLMYRYELAPGAQPAQVQVGYEGVEDVVSQEGGGVVADTRFGEISGLLAAPSGDAQVFAGVRQRDVDSGESGSLAGGVRNTGNVELVYSTYLGGSSYDIGYSIAVDGSGCAYVTGYTYSTNFPTENAWDGSHNGSYEAFVTKLSASGNSLLYSTYLGGTGRDYGYGIAVDGSGCAYVTGTTWSTDFPTENAYDDSYNGFGDVDAFVTKLSAAGNSLIYSTYLGGSDGESGYGIAVDGSGCAYVTGTTISTNFPTESAWDDSHNGSGDAFVTKLSASGSSLIYSTYLGGSNYENCRGIAVDGSGCAYVTGHTSSTNFPTENAWDDSHNGSYEAFVTKLSASGNSLLYSTYLGGTGRDYGYGIAVDGSGCAYVTGTTWSTDFPTENAWDDSLNGSGDAFVTRFSASGGSLIYSTYLGGSDWESGYGIAVDGTGCAYVTAYTQSTDFPTENAWDGSHNGGDRDVFVTKLSAAGNSLIYSTYLGGSGDDRGYGIAVDGSDCAYGAC